MTLAHRSFSALKWNYLGASIRVFSQLFIGIVLARLLGPEPFGLVAIAWLVIGLGNMVADLGFGSALVHSSRVEGSDTRYVFTLLLLIASMMTALIVAGSSAIGAFFHRPDASPVLQALAFVFVIQALGQVSASLLRRELNFKAIQMVQAGSYIVAYVAVGVPLAVIGMGVWSLVLAALVQAALCSAGFFVLRPHSIRPCLKVPQQGYFGFGSKVMGSNLANFTINNIDTAVIGRVFGAVDLGLYSRCLQLVTTPMNALMSNLSAVLFPAYSRARGNPASVRSTFFASLTIVGLLCLPTFAAIAAVPEAVVIGLYGERWAAAVPLLMPLSLSAAITGMLALGGPLLTGVGRPGLEFRAQAASAAITVAALVAVAAGGFSLVDLAWTLFGVFLVRFFLVTQSVLNVIAGRWWEVLTALRPPLAIAAVTVAVVKGADVAEAAIGLSPSVRLVVAGTLGALCVATSVVRMRKWIFARDAGWFLSSIEGRLPRVLRGLLTGTASTGL